MSNPSRVEAAYQSIPATVPDEESDSLRPPPPFARQLYKGTLVSEFFGTAILVQIGCGANCIQLYLVQKSVAGQWQVTAIWMLAAILGIYISAPQSGGHLNPAVTMAFALVRPRDFPYKSVLPYWIAQLLGGITAGLINMMLFTTAILSYEDGSKKDHGLKSAAAFGDYWR
jgi:glycerol uptake facilitator protein